MPLLLLRRLGAKIEMIATIISGEGFYDRVVTLVRQLDAKWSLLALGRALVRAVLAVVLFAVACSALTAISLVAMFFERRMPAFKTSSDCTCCTGEP